MADDSWFVPPWGVNGGAPGARATKLLRRVDGTETVVGNKLEDIKVEAEDELDFITWAGAAGAIRWTAIPRWWRSKCGRGWSL